MTNTIQRHHFDYVSSYVDQTKLVRALLRQNIMDYDNMSSWDIDEYGDYPGVVSWLTFQYLNHDDYDKLREAGVIVLASEYGTWVAVTESGTLAENFDDRELIEILFDVEQPLNDMGNIKRE